jgi:hypothetical protein
MSEVIPKWFVKKRTQQLSGSKRANDVDNDLSEFERMMIVILLNRF